MDLALLVTLIILGAIIIGVAVGAILLKIYTKRLEANILQGARDVMNGKRKNSIKIDGVEHDATKFKVRNGDEEEDLLEFGKGSARKVAQKLPEAPGEAVLDIPTPEIPTPEIKKKPKKKSSRRITLRSPKKKKPTPRRKK